MKKTSIFDFIIMVSFMILGMVDLDHTPLTIPAVWLCINLIMVTIRVIYERIK